MNHQASYKELLAKLQEKTGKTEEAINKQLEEKTKKFSGLLSKEAALFLLAKEAGITPNQDRLVELTPINQLQQEQLNVDILGVAKHVFSVIEFKNKEKPGTGKKASILLADATGEVFVTFWHKDTEKIQNIPSGTPILLRGVSVSSYNNQTQVSFGYRSQLETNPSQAQEITLPQITLEKISIKEIQPPLFNFCLEATVDEVLPVKEFITQKGENGKLQRIRLMDKNDSILAVAWNEKVLESEMLKPGQKILLENVRAKTDWQGGKEISLDKNARIIVLEEKKEV